MKSKFWDFRKVGFCLVLSILSLKCSDQSSGTDLKLLLGVLQLESETGVLFDDFSYSDTATATAENGWSFRTGSGGPGPSGVAWSESRVSFGTEGSDAYLRLSAITDGTIANSVQSEMETGARKFFRGTYASRIRFFDSPTTGSASDQLNQTFFLITPLVYGGDPAYSECDFEYLGQGGWGEISPTMFLTTWETYNPNTNFYDDISYPDVGSLDGWHVLVLQVSESSVKYYINGNLIKIHSGKYVPESPMTISFNLWFLGDTGGLETSNTSTREYEQRVDWVYFVKNRILSPQKIQEEIDSLRSKNVLKKDTVPN